MANDYYFRLRIYSDRDIDYPEAYFRGVFGAQYSSFWTIRDVTGSCLTVESDVITDTNEFNPVEAFESITPEMYDSTRRSYVPVMVTNDA